MRFMIILFLLIIVLPQTCCAANIQEQIISDDDISHMMDSLPKDASDIVKEYDIHSYSGLKSVGRQIIERILSELKTQTESALQPIISIMIIIIICSISYIPFTNDKKTFPIIIGGGTAIVSIALSDAPAFYGQATEAIRSIYDFSTILMPCMASASIISGATVSAGVKYTAAALFMNMMLNFCNSFLLPMISVYLVCVIGETLFEQKIMGSAADFIKWLCKTLITTSVILFTSYLSVAGLVTTAGDKLATQVTKTAISGALPVVGNIISNTASILVTGASMLRNSIGIFGMLSVISILIIPFITLGIRYLLFKGVAVLADFFPNHRFSKLLHGFACAFGMILGVLGTGFVIIFLTLISFMQLIG